MPQHRRFHHVITVLTLSVLVLVTLGAPAVRVNATSAALAQNYFVTSDLTAPDADCSMAKPCGLQAAVELAANGDKIYIEEGTYTSTGAQVVHINKDLWLQGGWNGTLSSVPIVDPLNNPTVLDGENARPVVLIDGSITSPTLHGLTIVKGRAHEGNGGGVKIANTTGGVVAIDSCKIMNNYSSWIGGGISVEKASVVVENSLIAENTAYSGGGIVAWENSVVSLRNNAILGNRSEYLGAAVFAFRAHLFVRSNLLAFNTGPETISVDSQESSNLMFVNNMIVENQGNAFAIGSSQGQAVSFLHNTLVNNAGSGLILSSSTSGMIANNIFQGHSKESINMGSPSTATVTNNLFWQNASNPNLGANAILEDPMLDSTYHLTPGSPAIDLGIAWTVTEDIDGDPRPVGLPDIGADEILQRLLFLPQVMR